MSTTVSVIIQLKALIASVLAFIVVLQMQKDNVRSSVNQLLGGVQFDNQDVIIIFLVLLMVLSLFEILYKYEAKTCELTEGIFAALFGVLGFFVGNTIQSKVGTSSSPIPGALGAGIGMWVWKSFLKNALAPLACNPCQEATCAPCAPCPILEIKKEAAPPAVSGPQK